MVIIASSLGESGGPIVALPGWAGSKVIVAGKRCHRHRLIGPDWAVILVGLVGQSWGRDKISKDEQKSVLARLAYSHRYAVEKGRCRGKLGLWVAVVATEAVRGEHCRHRR